MAASSLFALIDDIATLLDDVAVLSKMAAKRTTSMLGDDLALNAQQVVGVPPDRELPVVWAVAKGSLRNKAILVPAALAVSALVPWLVRPLLMLGGCYLCHEGFEKVAHLGQPPDSAERLVRLAEAGADPLVVERQQIQGAIRTDFILSAEIITLCLGIVAKAAFATRVLVLAGLAVLLTAAIYGVVAGIVKLDDLGLHLSQKQGPGRHVRLLRASGVAILRSAPLLMKVLTVGGTLAMFLVGGGILAEGWSWEAAGVRSLRAVLGPLAPLLVHGAAGLAAGALALGGTTLARRALAGWRRRG